MRYALYLSSVTLFAISLFLGRSTTQAQDLDTITEPVSAYIQANPDTVSVICGPVGAEPTIDHNADQRQALASSMKVYVLLELGRQVDAGMIALDEAVLLADVNAYWLPETDGGAQDTWLAELGDVETVTIAQLADAMIRLSSNATTDYLLQRLGTAGFTELYADLGIVATDVPSLILGWFLVQDNHETGPADPATLDMAAFTAEAERVVALYLSDPEWAAATQAYISSDGLLSTLLGDGDADAALAQQGAFYARFGAQGTARDLITALAAVYDEDYYTAETRAFMQEMLSWPLASAEVASLFDVLATKGGALSGILTSVYQGQASGGERVQLAVFYRDLPGDLWLDWITAGNMQILELRALGLGGDDCGLLAASLTDEG